MSIDQLNIEPLLKKYKGGGTSSYHPQMMLKVMVYAYTQRIYTSRRIAKALRENIQFMWISGSDFISVSDEYTFKTATSGGGGGGGGGGVPGPVTVAGVTNITKVVSATGVFSQSIYAWSDDNQVLVYAAAGTTGLNADGTPLAQISLIHMTAPPAFQTGAGMITLTYDFTPAGARN